MKTAMMSIHEPYAKAIFAGRKKFEYRTRCPSFEGPTRVLVYIPGKQGRIIGEFIVTEILKGSPISIWRKTHTDSGLGYRAYMSYFQDRDDAYALQIEDFSRWRVSPQLSDLRDVFGPRFRPPQFFMWVDDHKRRALAS